MRESVDGQGYLVKLDDDPLGRLFSGHLQPLLHDLQAVVTHSQSDLLPLLPRG